MPGEIKRVVISKDKDGKQTGTGYMDVFIERRYYAVLDMGALTKAVSELESNGKKVGGFKNREAVTAESKSGAAECNRLGRWLAGECEHSPAS